MQNKLTLKNVLVLIASIAVTGLSTGSALASGGGGGGGGFGGGFGGASVPQPRVVDQNYETGKAIFNGRAGGQKIAYCIKDKNADGELVPVKGKSIRSYKRAGYQDLAENLFNCDDPENLVANQLKRDDFLYVMYYLNKRYKLALK